MNRRLGANAGKVSSYSCENSDVARPPRRAERNGKTYSLQLETAASGKDACREMNSRWLAVAVAAQFALAAAGALAEDTGTRQVPIWLFDAQVRAFAPGIEGIITLKDEQKDRLGKIYSEVFGQNSVALANMVLQDARTSLMQRQAAAATLTQAQELFRAKSREVFTTGQQDLIDKIYVAYNEVAKAAQQELVDKVKAQFGAKLDGLLNADQKKGMEKKKAEIEEAQKKAAEAQQPATAPLAAGGKPEGKKE